ncbi:putative MFS family arabinose efflux permease [Rudaeicoccus suwonensis]|uniref:Putative MFS family arabinose efflux permease n=2 Tax=Rudaeicoccus suwonensis TaxID=657409 RepID=A0A561DVP3_9MICO|nr:putative MFS family arabinose efflux permease [Rudaeicoccus suwonensis]
MSVFVLPLVTVALTGSAAQAGVVGGAATLGTVLFILPAGALVDRWHRRRVMLISSAVRAAIWAAIGVAGLLHDLTLTYLIVAAFLSNVAETFFSPAEGASVRKVVTPEQLPTAMAVNEGRQAAASLIGGPLGGLLFGLNIMFPFFFNALSFVASLIGVCTIRYPLGKAEQTEDAKPTSIVASIAAGLRFVWSRPAMRDIFIVSAILNFGITAIDLTIILNLKIRGETAAEIGFISASAGAGVFLGAAVAPRVIKRIPTGKISIFLGWVLLTTYSIMALLRESLYAQIFLVFIALFMVPALNAGLNSYTMLVTPDAFQGRVQNAGGFMVMILMPFAAFLGGTGLEYLGAGRTMLVLVLILAIGPVLLTANKHIRHIPLISELGDQAR